MSEKYNERQVLLDLANGSKEAFEVIYNRYFDRVYRVALLFLKSEAQAEDITQEIFLSIFIKKNFTHVDKFQFYLHRLTRNKCLRVLKSLEDERTFSRELAVNFESLDRSKQIEEDLIEIEQLYKELHEAIEKLPPGRKRIIQMKSLMGLNDDAIAKELNLSKNTVKSSGRKAMEDLIQHLRHDTSAFIIFYFLLFL